MTYWLLHDVCDALARETFEAHAFGATLHQQHTTFSNGGQVWANRGSNALWTVADGKTLPQYGFYAKTPGAEAGVVLLDGQRAGFAQSEKTYFADARPAHHSLRAAQVESATAGGTYLGNGAFEVIFNWNVLDPSFDGYVPFIHVCSDKRLTDNGERIAFQPSMKADSEKFKRAGLFTTTARIAVPQNMPAGEYRIRYGLYSPAKGDRMSVRGVTDGGQRILGGVLKVEKTAGSFTGGSFALETSSDDEKAQGVNMDKKMLDFGPLVTDGAFRLLHGERKAWQLIPLPGGGPFRAEIRLEAFGAKRAKVKAVAKMDAINAAAQEPVWAQDGATLRLSGDGQSFGYRIVFE